MRKVGILHDYDLMANEEESSKNQTCTICGTSPMIFQWGDLPGEAMCTICGCPYQLKWGGKEREEEKKYPYLNLNPEFLPIAKEYWESAHEFVCYGEMMGPRSGFEDLGKWLKENHPEWLQNKKKEKKMEIMIETNKFLQSKSMGEDLAKEALPTLVEIVREIKHLEGAMEEESEPFKNQLAEIRKKYLPALEPLNKMSNEIRERVMEEYEGNETIGEKGIGKLVFAERWGYEIVDFSKVEKKYRIEAVDNKKITDEIKNGVRKIKGLGIIKIRSLKVYLE